MNDKLHGKKYFTDKREKKNEIERFNVPLLCLASALVASVMSIRGMGD